LISVEPPNAYVILAAGALEGGYLVPGDGSDTFLDWFDTRVLR
jgi:hypothetical protein